MTDKGLKGNEKIEEGIKSLKENFTDESLAAVLTVIRKRTLENGQFVVAVDTGASDINLSLKTATMNGKKWFIAFTSFEEQMLGNTNVMSGFLANISELLEMTMKTSEVEGIVLNPYGNMMTLNKQIIEVIKG